MTDPNPNGRSRRHAWTMVEAMMSVVLVCVLGSSLAWECGFGHRATTKLSAQLFLHQNSRKALVRLLTEIQEGMEVISPAPGSTLSFALVRDKVSVVRWFYQRRKPGTTDVYELCRYLADPKIPESRRTEVLLSDVARLTFTSQSEGALQINLQLEEDQQAYAMLTTVRLRNLAAAEAIW